MEKKVRNIEEKTKKGRTGHLVIRDKECRLMKVSSMVRKTEEGRTFVVVGSHMSFLDCTEFW